MTADVNLIAVDFTVLVDGDTISRTPPFYGISVVSAGTPSGDVKWQVFKVDSTISTLVAYGQVPAGATQIYPLTGTPAPLAPGDEVQILGGGTTIDGVMYLGAEARRCDARGPTA